MTTLYGIQSGLFIKVGFTRNVRNRMNAFQAGNPHPMQLVMCRSIDPNFVGYIEARTHFYLHAYSVGREWFMTDVATVKAAASLAVKEVGKLRKELGVWHRALERAERTGEPCTVPPPDYPVANPYKIQGRQQTKKKPSLRIVA